MWLGHLRNRSNFILLRDAVNVEWPWLPLVHWMLHAYVAIVATPHAAAATTTTTTIAPSATAA